MARIDVRGRVVRRLVHRVRARQRARGREAHVAHLDAGDRDVEHARRGRSFQTARRRGHPPNYVQRARHHPTDDVRRRTSRRGRCARSPRGSSRCCCVLYVIAYLDRVNVTFAQDKLEERPRLLGRGLRLRRRHLLHRLLLPRGPEQPRAAPVRRAPVDGADHDHVGRHLGVHDVRAERGELLRACASCWASPRPGFFPGMILYLSYWFPARERAKAVGFFMSAIAISYAIGAPISGGDHVGVRRRRRAQRLAVAVPHRGDPGRRSPASSCSGYLDDGPEHASWLERDEKALARAAPRGRGAHAPARRAPHGGRGPEGPPRAAVRPPVLLHGRQRLRPVVLGRRDRRQHLRAERGRQGLRHRDPVRVRDRRPRR